ncbi:MAG TPA: NADH-quinone oxidoreductase subunit J [Candidatus Dormibacteraeota bacterium]|nr:NADH-quinone oxidoreductase subunit J [Candidatus Dormibacteraeota bacterium]
MDSLHAIGFYVSAALSVAGGLSVAFLPDRSRRALALGASGIGVAGIYASLSAAFAGVIALVCFAGCAALLAGPGYRIVELHSSGRWRQAGALAAAALFALLAYSAFRGHFANATFLGGSIAAAPVGRLLFTHDALAAEAVGALILVALVGATAAWRARERKL